MQTGKVCKISAVVLFVLDFIGSMELGDEFGFTVFLYGIIAGFIFCISLYALGEIVEKLVEIAENTTPITYSAEQKKQIKNNREIKSTFKADGIMDIPKRKKQGEDLNDL